MLSNKGLTSWFNWYSYARNCPLMYRDPSGWFYTKFLDKAGNVIQDINDGSNAVFQLTGDSRAEEYFKFKEYEKNPNKSNTINIASVIKAAQDYTRENYTSEEIVAGKWKTYCNQGTMNIARSYESAVNAAGMMTDISDIRGKAEIIGANLAKSTVVESLTSVKAAQKAAKDGNLVFGYWDGHIFTLNKDGMANNVGPKRPTNNIFDPQYTEKYNQKFYMLILRPQ